MRQGSIIGYDLNDQFCQISYYSEEQQEPETMEVSVDNYQIPLTIATQADAWRIGKEAKRLATVKPEYTAGNLLSKAVAQEKIVMDGKTYEAVWVLAKYIEISLKSFEKVEHITFTLPEMSVEITKILKGIGQRLGIEKECVYVQDYRESFCHYMFYQPKELWQYEAALFYCDRKEVRAYMLRKLNAGFGKGKEVFVTVDEVANARMKELAAVYPVLNVDKAKDADASFKQFIQSVFEKKLVSSVFLTGEGFENNWYPNSLKVLCNGRRAFLGNNLYSKGACYTAYIRMLGRNEGPIYLDGTKMADQICIKMRIRGEDVWYPLVAWGSHWYESDRQLEVLLEDTEDIELHIESLGSGELKVETVSLFGLPKRKDYALRLQIQVMFLDERTCKIKFRDVGFGEFFAPTDFEVEKEIHLGGSHGQFNSLS